MGEAASPVCFELAKRLKKAPRQIAQEIAGSLPKIEGIGRVEVAGAGYLNAFFDRGWFWENARQEASAPSHELSGNEKKKVMVEHRSINPNKAANIGDLLARESEMLHLHFWDAAFEKLKASGAIQLATSGKNAGCWIMPWGKEVKDSEQATEAATAPAEEEDQAKIIVRSNGTVTYVGKDIAYQLWKFGLLGKDFHYRRWPNPPDAKELWATTAGANEAGAPHFGGAEAVYNVIDARQAYLQEVVAEGLRALGHAKEAENSIHFDYEIVALTPRCAAEMGYELSAEDAKRPYVEVSGRKGFGVKADDLITRMLAAAEARVLQKHAEMAGTELKQTANALAVGG